MNPASTPGLTPLRGKPRERGSLGNIGFWLRRRLTWDPQRQEFVGDDEANRSRENRAPWHRV